LWIQAVSEAYGFKIRALAVSRADGTLAGASAFCEMNEFPEARLLGIPFSDTCDPLLGSYEVWPLLLAGLQEREIPVHFRCLREDRFQAADGLDVTKKARWHRIPVIQSEEEQWRLLSPPTRRAVRRSRCSGIEVRPLEGSSDLLGFYSMHVALRKTKYRLLAQPLSFFEALEARFRRAGCWHSLGAFVGTRMVAATVYLRWGDTLYYKFNASSPIDLVCRPNSRLIWDGIALARSVGCRYLDLGPSDDNQPGLIRFKRSFGAEEEELRFLRWSPRNWRQPVQGKKLLRDITKLMTEPALSDELTARAGELLYRFFA